MKTRPSTLDDFLTRYDGLITERSMAAAHNFKPRPTDVIISPYNKSGTTWVQQIVHGLRTRGDMDFDDISRVVPWLEVSADLDIDIEAEQRANPRAYKSHFDWHEMPKGGRYIVPIRDPKDVLVSSYHFQAGWFFERGAFTLEELADSTFLNPSEGRGYWNHLLSWWSPREQENVLLLSFESMKADLPTTVKQVAAFIGVELDEALLDLVVHQSSFDFMCAHVDRFDDLLMRGLVERVGQLPSGSDGSKVRSGKVGEHKEALTPALHEKLDQNWAELIEPVLGFGSYQELVEAL